MGSIAGGLTGLLMGWGFNALGVEWQPPGTVETSLLAVRLGLMTATPPFLVGVISTLLSAIFPAIQTSGIRVVNALRVN